MTCGGISSNDPTVCGGNGNCTDVDKCICTKFGYYGVNCTTTYTCNGVHSFDTFVCNRNGICSNSKIITK